MEIYEKKHLFIEVCSGIVCLMMIALGLAMLYAVSGAWCSLSWWVSISGLVCGMFCVPIGMVWLWFRFRRYVDLCIDGRPAVVISSDCLHIYTPFDEDTVIPWDEIADFKTVHTKDRNVCYPVYRDYSRNKGRYLFLAYYRDAILTDYLTISEDDLLRELRARLDCLTQNRPK